MSEVLDIEVDGEISRPAGHGSDDRATQWGFPVAIALVGSLLLAVLVLVVLPALTRAGDSARVAPSPAASPPLVPTAEVPVSTTVSLDRRIAAAQGALAAWGKFVEDGDLERLKPWFAEDGPQYRQLAEEAGALTATEGRTGYLVLLREPSVLHEGPDRAVVGGKVTWARSSETEQEYAWEVVLRNAGEDRWLLWTVREG
jgi:hypothetical protein